MFSENAEQMTDCSTLSRCIL